MQNNNLLAHWQYTTKEWDEFVTIEKANKKEDSIYLGIGILVLGTFGLIFLRNTSFFMGLSFAAPLSVLIPFLRMKFSYTHLKKGIKNPEVKIFNNQLLINNQQIELDGSQKRVRKIQIIDTKNHIKLLELDVQWLTRKGPTNDDFRILIPKNKLEEAETIVAFFEK